jgi:hypothetical protein
MANSEEVGLRLSILENRVDVLEDEVLKNSKYIKESMVRISDGVRTESTEREISDDRKGKELKIVESTLTLDLNLERANRKETEVRIMKEVDERCIRLSMEMDLGFRATRGSEVSPQEFSRLRQDLEAERKKRQDFEDAIVARIDGEAKLLHELILTEKRLREESTKSMTGLLDNFRARFSEDLLKEQRARQASENTMQHLIDEISKKM